MVRSYATKTDVIEYRGAQDATTLEKLEAILPVISAQFRVEASNYGKDLDAMVDASEDLAEVTKVLVIDGAFNYVNSSTNLAPMTQMSESAGGYSISGTLANPFGGLYTKKNWLKMLGVSKQTVGTIEPFNFGGCADVF